MAVKRIGWVDIIRGCCVFLVVMGHIWKGTYFHLFFNSFKMPMFYILAGLFIKTDKPLITNVKNCLFRLGMPWLVFSLYWTKTPYKIPYYMFCGNWELAKSSLVSFITVENYWFIPSFFVAQCLFCTLSKICRGKNIPLLASSVVCFVIGYFVRADFMSFWCIGTALTSVIFIEIGYILKDHLDAVEHCAVKYGIPIIILYLLLFVGVCFIQPLASIDFHNIDYGNFPVAVVLVIVGNAALLCFGILLDKYVEPHLKFSVLQLFGRNTLVVYLLARGTYTARQLGSLVNIEVDSSVVSAFVFTLIVSLITAVISEIFSFLLPWAVGLKKRSGTLLQLQQFIKDRSDKN